MQCRSSCRQKIPPVKNSRSRWWRRCHAGSRRGPLLRGSRCLRLQPVLWRWRHDMASATTTQSTELPCFADGWVTQHLASCSSPLRHTPCHQSAGNQRAAMLRLPLCAVFSLSMLLCSCWGEPNSPICHPQDRSSRHGAQR